MKPVEKVIQGILQEDLSTPKHRKSFLKYCYSSDLQNKHLEEAWEQVSKN